MESRGSKKKSSTNIIQQKIDSGQSQSPQISNTDISKKTNKSNDRDIVIQQLISLSVIHDVYEFHDYLNRRQHAIEWVTKAAKSDAVKLNEKNKQRSDVSVFMFYDENDYADLGITPTYFETNLFLESIDGGRRIVDAYHQPHALHGDELINPLNLQKCPQYNVKVATNVELASSGGYFKKKPKEYNPPKKISLLQAYAYEFENFNASRLVNNECPFITLDSKNNTELAVGILDGKITLKEEVETKKLYLKQDAYREFIKNNLLRQMRSVVYAHQQAGLTNKPIHINLTLPGMGFFATLDAKFSIKSHLAKFAAEGYKEALEEFNNEQMHRIPKITHVRLAYDDRTKDEGNAIDSTFESSFIIGDIKITKTTDAVENIDEKVDAYQVVFVNGDPRTYPGNEQRKDSQEPGIYSNIVNGRDELSAIINPFQVLDNVCSHYLAAKQINQAYISDSKEMKAHQQFNREKLQFLLQQEQDKHNQLSNLKFNDVVIHVEESKKKNKPIALRKTLSNIIQSKLDLSDKVDLNITQDGITLKCDNLNDMLVLQKEFAIMNINPIIANENLTKLTYTISDAKKIIDYLTYQYKNEFKKELGNTSAYEKLLLIGFEESMQDTLGWSEPPPYFDYQGDLIYTYHYPILGQQKKIIDLNDLQNADNNLVLTLKEIQSEKRKPHQLILEIEKYIKNQVWKFDGMFSTYTTNLNQPANKDNSPDNLPTTVKKHWDDIQAYKKNLSAQDPIILFEKIKSEGIAAAKEMKKRYPNTTDYYNIYLKSDKEIKNYFMAGKEQNLELKK